MHSVNDRITTNVSTETARAISAYFSNCDLFTLLLHIGIHFLLIAKKRRPQTSVRQEPHIRSYCACGHASKETSDVESLALAPSPASLETTAFPLENPCSILPTATPGWLYDCFTMERG